MRFKTAALLTTSALALGLGASFIPTTASAVPCSFSGTTSGILAISNQPGSAITIKTTGAVIADNPVGHTVGVAACASLGGPISIEIGAPVVSNQGEGIILLDETGPITALIKDDVTATTTGVSIQSMTAGAISLQTLAGADITGGSSGLSLRAVSSGGNININTAGNLTGGTALVGTSGGGSVLANIDGALTSTNGEGLSVGVQTGSATVNVGLSGFVLSNTSAGVHVEAGGGNATVNVTGVVAGAGTGIIAGVAGSGATAVAVTGVVTGAEAVRTNAQGGATTITNAGELFGSAGVGIGAASNNGAITIVNTLEGSITTNDLALSPALTAQSKSGAVTVLNDGVIEGRSVLSTGAAAISWSGAGIAFNDKGSAVNLTSSGSITVNNAGTINGAGTAGQESLTAAGGAPVTIVNSGTITTGAANHKGIAIDTTGAAPVTLTNTATGVIDGRIQAGGKVTFNNAGTWTTNGVSRFGNAASASGNTLTNTGIVAVGNDSPAGKVNDATFKNLGRFQNGTASATGTITMVNGRAGDSLTIDGDYKGTKGHSVLALDAFLGGNGSNADVLNIGGASTGQTVIRINDTNAGKGGLNTAGITLVTGVTGKNDFVLDTTAPNYDAKQGGIPKGLFVYELSTKGGEAELTSSINLKGAQLPTLLTALQEIFFGSGLSEFLTGDVPAFAEDSPRLWMNSSNWRPDEVNPYRSETASLTRPGLQAGFDTALVAERAVSRVSDQTGETLSMNAGYSQNTSSIVTGFDLVRGRRDDSAWTLGLAGGYIRSDQVFFTGQVLAQYDGARVGLYGRLARGAWRFDGEVRSDVLALRYLSTGADGAGTGRAASLGAQASARYIAPLGGSWTLEPSAAVSVSATRLSDLELYGTPLAFSGGNSVRAALGLKLKGGWMLGDWRARAELTGQVWNEFAGVNTAMLAPDDPELAVSDRLTGAWADLGAKLNLSSGDERTTAYLSTGLRISQRYQAASIGAGVAVRW
ncbi:MAG: autotransporter outer membrane beta-barrel domain-containing protein [Caulobacteraceae bacterium]